MRATRAERQQATRAALVTAARSLVAAEGAAVSVDRIAEAAGVTTGAVYSNFRNKSDLLAAVIVEDLRSGTAEVLDVPGHYSLRQTLAECARRWVEWAAAVPAERVRVELGLILLALEDPALGRQLSDSVHDELAQWARTLTGRAYGGGRRTSSDDAVRLACALRATLRGFAVQHSIYGVEADRRDVIAACEGLTRLLGVQPRSVDTA